MRILGGIFRGQTLKTPKSQTTRPTQGALRAAVFNICQNRIEDASFLDLFAGSGAMGLEALSRGAKECTFVEKDRIAAQCILENCHRLQVVNQTKIIKNDVAKALLKINDSFDIIYLDPPYGYDLKECLSIIKNRNLLNKEGLLFVEEEFEKVEQTPNDNFLVISKRRFGGSQLTEYLCH